MLKFLLKNFKKSGFAPIEEWINIAKDIGVSSSFLGTLSNSYNYNYYSNERIWTNISKNQGNDKVFILNEGKLTEYTESELSKVDTELKQAYDNQKSYLRRLLYFLKYQQTYKIASNSVNPEHINPLFSRIEQTLESLEPLIELKDDKNEVEGQFKCLNVFSLINTNQEVKRLMPMMISKMLYDIQKEEVCSMNKIGQTCHLIIDEAHNILNSEHTDNTDSWQDYRLSIFEEIIKEGRKFGFYLTLASQRPADISPTIMSQIHNFFIHRLVMTMTLICSAGLFLLLIKIHIK